MLSRLAAIFLCLGLLGLGQAASKISPPDWNLPVLCYHQFGPEDKGGAYQISAERFEMQLAWLRENGYQSVNLKQVQAAVDGNLPADWPARPVLLTIDDGFQNSWTVGGPVLKKYGYRAVYYIVTDQVGTSKSYLTWDQVREIRKEGFDVGSHTRTHANIAKPKKGESAADFKARIFDELKGSRQKLENELGESVTSLAYPYGAYNRVIEKWVEEAGYRHAFSVTKGHNQNVNAASRFRLGRNLLMGHPSQAAFIRHIDSVPLEILPEIEGAIVVKGEPGIAWRYTGSPAAENQIIEIALDSTALGKFAAGEIVVTIPEGLATGFHLVKLKSNSGGKRFESHRLFQVIKPEWAKHFNLEKP